MKIIKNWLIAPKNVQAKFNLYYKQIEIGTLELKNELWLFRYFESFKKQTFLKPISDFPDLNKEYQSKELWPFFTIRVPSIEHPKIKNLIKLKYINNIVDLLIRFGNKSIANPYNLMVVKTFKG